MVRRADRALQDTVARNRAKLHEHAQREADKRRKIAEDALGALVPALDEMAEFIRLGTWATEFPNYRGRRWGKPFNVPDAEAEIDQLVRWVRSAMAERPDPPDGTPAAKAGAAPKAA